MRVKDHILRAAVVWADNTHDSHKTCSECGLETCIYPVHKDYYRVLVSKEARRFEAEAFNIDEENTPQVIE